MSKRLLTRLVFLAALLPFAAFADVSVEWTRYFGDGTNELPHKVALTPDGGFSLVGRDWVGRNGFQINAARFDSEGNQLFQTSYLGGNYSGDEYGYGIAPHPDGGFLLAGIAQWSSRPFVIVRIGEDGRQLWRKHLGEGTDPGNLSLLTDGEGFVLIGSLSTPSNPSQILILNIDREGNLLDSSTVDLADGAQTQKAIRTADGGFAVLTYTFYSSGVYGTPLLLRVSSDGTLLWRWSGPWADAFLDLVETSSGEFVLAGTTDVGEFSLGDMLVTKVSGSGVALWRKTFDNSEQEYLAAIVATPDGGFLAAGTGDYLGGPYLARLDGAGRMLWEQVLDPADDEYHPSGFSQVQELIALPEGGFALVGVASGYYPVGAASNNIDGVLVKLGPVDPIPQLIHVGIDIYPGYERNLVKALEVLPVAILSRENFDATTLALPTLLLDGAPIVVKGRKWHYALRDVNGDGLVDFVGYFNCRKLRYSIGRHTMELTGETIGGQPFRGTDFVVINGPRGLR